jgi:hypothetical protein
LLGFDRWWSMHSGGRPLVALPAAESSVDGVRVRWLALGWAPARHCCCPVSSPNLRRLRKGRDRRSRFRL